MRFWLFLALLLWWAPGWAQQVAPAVPSVTGFQRVLGTLRSANMNTTADQAIPINPAVSKYSITAIYATSCSGSMGISAGGFYPTTAKGGTAIVANIQVYSTLSSATVLLGATIVGAVAAITYTASTIYFSLTTASGSAGTCDLYIVGADLT